MHSFNFRALCALLIAGSFVLPAPTMARSTSADASNQAVCASPQQPVHEEVFVPIGSIEQWVTIHGEHCANPVILFLHGGPGNTLSPYADALYGSWQKEFTLVQWDQRGAGRTFGRSRPGEDDALTIEQMTADGIALAEYLRTRLGHDKIVLTGGSWGSILGVHMVKARPDLFHAYVGAAQIVSYGDNQSASYEALQRLARAAKDDATIATLEGLGAPPWTNPRNFGVIRRATRVYEAKTTTPAPKSWWAPAATYATAATQSDYTDGEDYSFLQFVGFRGDGMFSKVDLPALGLDFGIPVFLIHGAADLVATPGVAKRWFERIKAPRKEFVLVEHAGHDPNVAYIDAHLRVMREQVLPLIQ